MEKVNFQSNMLIGCSRNIYYRWQKTVAGKCDNFFFCHDSLMNWKVKALI